MYELIKRLPKVDLHVHLDGSVKPNTVIELAQTQGINLSVSNVKQLIPLIQVNDNCTDLAQYLTKFDLVSKVLHTSEALERVAFEIVEQAYEDNCKYIEVRFGPQLHCEKGLTVEGVIHSVIKGLKRGESVFGVKANAIACCLRHHTVEQNMLVIKAATGFLNHGLVGVDLAGDEASYPAYLFEDVFKLASKNGLPITIHAGEAGGPENIKVALNNLGAARIGHGVRLRENTELLNKLNLRRIPLEMCPVSNIQTKASLSWDDYPIREYFDLGLNITVNTDNLTVSNTNLTNEYYILKEKFNFSIGELGQLIMNAVDASFLNFREKKKLKSKCLLEYSKIVSVTEQVI